MKRNPQVQETVLLQKSGEKVAHRILDWTQFENSPEEVTSRYWKKDLDQNF